MPTSLGTINAIGHPRPTVSPLTSAEAALLARMAKQGGWREEVEAALFPAFFVGLLTYVVPFALWRWLEPTDNPWQQQACFQALGWIVGVGIFLGFLWEARRTGGNWKEQIRNVREDANGGSAHSVELDVARAVEIEEYEDEGAGFFLELTDGRVLCLISQDLYVYASDVDLEDGEEDRRSDFPQTRIRYRYGPRSGFCLDLTGIGETLRPFGKVKTTGRFFKKDKQTGQHSYTGPEDGTVYEGPLEATLASFKYKLKPL